MLPTPAKNHISFVIPSCSFFHCNLVQHQKPIHDLWGTARYSFASSVRVDIGLNLRNCGHGGGRSKWPNIRMFPQSRQTRKTEGAVKQISKASTTESQDTEPNQCN